MAAKMGEDMRVQYAWVCEGGLARPRGKDTPLVVVEIAEKAPMSWRKRPPPCGDTDMPFVMEVEERLLGSACGTDRDMPLVMEVVERLLGSACGTDTDTPLAMKVVERLLGSVCVGQTRTRRW